MSRLFFLILVIAVGSCAGVAVIAVLAMGHYTAQAIITAGAIGAVVGVGAAFVVSRLLLREERDHGRDVRD